MAWIILMVQFAFLTNINKISAREVEKGVDKINYFCPSILRSRRDATHTSDVLSAQTGASSVRCFRCTVCAPGSELSPCTLTNDARCRSATDDFLRKQQQQQPDVDMLIGSLEAVTEQSTSVTEKSTTRICIASFTVKPTSQSDTATKGLVIYSGLLNVHARRLIFAIQILLLIGTVLMTVHVLYSMCKGRPLMFDFRCVKKVIEKINERWIKWRIGNNLTEIIEIRVLDRGYPPYRPPTPFPARSNRYTIGGLSNSSQHVLILKAHPLPSCLRVGSTSPSVSGSTANGGFHLPGTRQVRFSPSSICDLIPPRLPVRNLSDGNSSPSITPVSSVPYFEDVYLNAVDDLNRSGEYEEPYEAV